MVKSKYDKRTDLPSARARRFESDERDLSPAWLPLFGSSWRIGRGRACDLTPLLPCTPSSGSCGRRSFWLGFRCTPEWTPIVSLLDHEPLLLPVEEFKEYFVDPDAELDFSRSDIDPSLHTIQKRSSEDKV